MAKLQHTSPTLGDCIVHDDDSVTVDGVLEPNAVVTYLSDGTIRLDVDGNGIINANDFPGLGSIKVTREPGWQGNLGYRVVLEDWAEDITPNAIGMAIYNQPDGNDYSYTTGAMLWDATAEEWYCTCPAGFEPGMEDIYMGFLYGSLNIAAFTMQSQWMEQTFSGGGDYDSAAQASYDLDGDGKPDRIVAMPRSTQAVIGGHAVISVDDDSINIDLDNDGDADIVFPR